MSKTSCNLRAFSWVKFSWTEMICVKNWHYATLMLLFQQTFRLIGSYLYFKTKAEAVDKIKNVALRIVLNLERSYIKWDQVVHWPDLYQNLNLWKSTINHYIIMSDLSNHIFSKSSWPPLYILKGRGLRDIKYDFPVWHGGQLDMDMVDMVRKDHLAVLSRTFGLVCFWLLILL